MSTKQNINDENIQDINNNELFTLNEIMEYLEYKEKMKTIEIMETEEPIESEITNLHTILAVVIMVYVAFNLYFLLEKFKIKD